MVPSWLVDCKISHLVFFFDDSFIKNIYDKIFHRIENGKKNFEEKKLKNWKIDFHRMNEVKRDESFFLF